MANPRELLDALREVSHPGLAGDIVSSRLVKDIQVTAGSVTVVLVPPTHDARILQALRAGVIERLRPLAGGAHISVRLDEPAAPEMVPQPAPPIAGVRHVLAVASGKGGVGKSTVAVNLTLALAGLGARVGLLDADVYGPSAPLMMGLDQRPAAGADQRIVPVERFGVKAISIGLFLDDGAPVIWRGPMVTKLLTQFFRQVEWGTLDHLIVDLPPGTGDAQLTLVQQAPLSGGLIVTTPQGVALADVRRGITMFTRAGAPVLGIVENMAYHLCGGCGRRTELFGYGGGRAMAQQFRLPFLGEIPLTTALREAGDHGEPLVVASPEHPVSRTFREIAVQVTQSLERRPTPTAST